MPADDRSPLPPQQSLKLCDVPAVPTTPQASCPRPLRGSEPAGSETGRSRRRQARTTASPAPARLRQLYGNRIPRSRQPPPTVDLPQTPRAAATTVADRSLQSRAVPPPPRLATPRHATAAPVPRARRPRHTARRAASVHVDRAPSHRRHRHRVALRATVAVEVLARARGRPGSRPDHGGTAHLPRGPPQARGTVGPGRRNGAVTIPRPGAWS